jgi:hypothetical protein
LTTQTATSRFRVCPACQRPLDFPKSVAQRNKFHALCRDIGLELGLTPGQVKAAVKQEHFGIDEFKVKGKWYRMIKSSEDAQRIEYGELIDRAYQWAAENGIEINDKHGKDAA